MTPDTTESESTFAASSNKMDRAPDHPAPAYDGGFQQAPPVVLGMTGEQLQALITEQNRILSLLSQQSF